MVDRSRGFFDLDDRLAELSAKGDNLERVKALVDFEMFRSALETAVARADRSKGGRPAFDHVLMFKVLVLQAMHALSDERAEFSRTEKRLLEVSRSFSLSSGRRRTESRFLRPSSYCLIGRRCWRRVQFYR
jgi:hypothetical protein